MYRIAHSRTGQPMRFQVARVGWRVTITAYILTFTSICLPQAPHRMTPHQRSQCNSRLGVEALEPRLALSGTGLTAQYFHNADFTGLAETRTEAVWFNWASGNPAAGVDADSFSVRWTGQLEAQYSELYTFNVLSDEGVRVWVDGQLIVDDWAPHLRRNSSGTISLQAGQRYDIRVDYYDSTGLAQIQLSWASASQPFQAIPSSRLYESPSGLLASYSDNTGGQLSRIDAAVDFNWELGQPHSSIDADGFDVTWDGRLRADYSEQYTFSTISDDGVRLWIAGELVIDNWTVHGATENQGTKSLEAGKWYDVKLEYFENTGFAEIELRWSSISQTGSGLFEVIPEANLRAMKAADVTFKNPLGVGADPFVIQWNGNYYMTMTTDGSSVAISRAQALQDIHPNSPGSDTLVVWSAPPGTNYSAEVWAPELHFLDGKWYIYVAASDGNNDNHRMHVLERDAADPFGPFVYKAQLAPTVDRWAIDGTVLEWQGNRYFVWSGWPGFSNGQQNLYIAQMLNPWTLRGDRVMISAPLYGWETHGMPINEGPQILIHDGKLHIIYSASGFWTPQYALGRLTYNGTGSLLNPASWTKAPQPVFQSGNGVVGVGHASFTKSPDGTEDWIVYHAHRNPAGPPGEEIRDVRIQPFTFFADDTPNFGPPLPLNQVIAAPSVGPDPDRNFVHGDYNANGVIDNVDFAVWKATFGNAVFPGSAADGNGDGVVNAGDYVVWRKRKDSPMAPAAGGGSNANPILSNSAHGPAPEANPTFKPRPVPQTIPAPGALNAVPRPQALIASMNRANQAAATVEFRPIPARTTIANQFADRHAAGAQQATVEPARGAHFDIALLSWLSETTRDWVRHETLSQIKEELDSVVDRNAAPWSFSKRQEPSALPRPNTVNKSSR
jgi:GH43 family beta-xylosidase